MVSNNYENAVRSPFLDVFKEAKVPVLVISNQLDEMVFKQVESYKGYNFVNIELGYEEMARELGSEGIKRDVNDPKVPEGELSAFTLWLKNET